MEPVSLRRVWLAELPPEVGSLVDRLSLELPHIHGGALVEALTDSHLR